LCFETKASILLLADCRALVARETLAGLILWIEPNRDAGTMKKTPCEHRLRHAMALADG